MAVFRRTPPQGQINPSGTPRVGHPPKGFDPRFMATSCLIWCRADVGITLNGSTVSGWADQSGNGNNLTQGTASLQPTWVEDGLNEYPELSFDGTDDVMTGPSFFGSVTSANSWTTAVVCRGWTWGGSTAHNTGRAVLGAPSGGGGYFNQPMLSQAGGGPGGGFYNGSAHKTAKAAAAGAQGASLVWIMVNDGGDLTIHVNGASGTTVSSAGSVQSQATTLAVGHGTGSGTSTAYWDGKISEVLVFNGALANGERGALEGYLMDRYGI